MNQTSQIRPQGYFSQNYSVANKGSTNGLELDEMTKVYFYGWVMVQPAIESINEMLTKLQNKYPKTIYSDDGDGHIKVSLKHRRERIVIRYDMNDPTVATQINGYVNDRYKNSVASFVWCSLKKYQQIKAEENQ